MCTCGWRPGSYVQLVFAWGLWSTGTATGSPPPRYFGLPRLRHFHRCPILVLSSVTDARQVSSWQCLYNTHWEWRWLSKVSGTDFFHCQGWSEPVASYRQPYSQSPVIFHACWHSPTPEMIRCFPATRWWPPTTVQHSAVRESDDYPTNCRLEIASR